MTVLHRTLRTLRPFRYALPLALGLSAAALTALPLSGCAALTAAGEDQLIASLEPAVRQAAEGYVKELSALATQVSSITSMADAVSVADKARPSVQRTMDYAATLNALPPETKDVVRRGFATKLKSSGDKFAAALSKLDSSNTYGPLIKPLVKQIPLFK